MFNALVLLKAERCKKMCICDSIKNRIVTSEKCIY